MTKPRHLISRVRYPQKIRWGGMKTKNKVCERWRNSYIHFAIDIGKQPSKKHKLTRIDGGLGWCKENCKWSLHPTYTKELSAINTSGHCGVAYNYGIMRWVATCQSKWLGCSKSKEEAIKIRKAYKIERDYSLDKKCGL